MFLWKRVGERWDQWGFVSQTHLYGFSIYLVIWPRPRSFCLHWHIDLVWFSRNTYLEALLCLHWNRWVLALKRQSELLRVYCLPCYFESSVPFFFLGCVIITVCVRTFSCSVISNSSRPYILQLASLLCPRNSPVKNTGVGCDFLLQGIFLTWGLNLHLLHCRQILYPWVTGEANIITV